MIIMASQLQTHFLSPDQEVLTHLSNEWDSTLDSQTVIDISQKHGISPEEVLNMETRIMSKFQAEAKGEIQDYIKEVVEKSFSGDFYAPSYRELFDILHEDGYPLYGIPFDDFKALFDELRQKDKQLAFDLNEVRGFIRKRLIESFDFAKGEADFMDKEDPTSYLPAIDQSGLEKFLTDQGLAGHEENIISILEDRPTPVVEQDVDEFLDFHGDPRSIRDLKFSEILDIYLKWNSLGDPDAMSIGILKFLKNEA